MSDEQRERFYQDIKIIEKHYRGQWDKRMMADYHWSYQKGLK